jgi:membrane associated rhomboid family serine protease
MRPVRRMGGGGFGGMPGLESMAARLTLAMLAGSVLTLATRNDFLLLVPELVLHLHLWRLITYGFVSLNALGIIFGGIILWSMGGWLEGVWGSRRLLLVGLGGTVLAGVLTVLASFVFPIGLATFAGGGVMGTIFWVAYGLTMGRGQTNFWGIPLTGNVFALIGVGFVVLQALQGGVGAALPDLFGVLVAVAYVKGGSPRGLWLHLHHWRLQRQLRNRSRNLRAVSSEPPNDRFLN